jgi:hypothetical protein
VIKAQAKFNADVLSLASADGAVLVPCPHEELRQEFVLQTPIGALRGGSGIMGSLIYMRFESPGSGRPGVAVADFNPHSHKWNIQGYDDSPEGMAAARERFSFRLKWAALRV